MRVFVIFFNDFVITYQNQNVSINSDNRLLEVDNRFCDRYPIYIPNPLFYKSDVSLPTYIL